MTLRIVVKRALSSTSEQFGLSITTYPLLSQTIFIEREEPIQATVNIFKEGRGRAFTNFFRSDNPRIITDFIDNFSPFILSSCDIYVLLRSLFKICFSTQQKSSIPSKTRMKRKHGNTKPSVRHLWLFESTQYNPASVITRFSRITKVKV